MIVLLFIISLIYVLVYKTVYTDGHLKYFSHEIVLSAVLKHLNRLVF